MAALSEALLGRGYAQGVCAAAPLLARIGRECRADACTTYFVAPGVLRVDGRDDPAADAALIVQIVGNIDGNRGATAAGYFRDGLRRAAICMYIGHWRYGLGPDFDPALAVEGWDSSGLPLAPRRLPRVAAMEARGRGEAIESTLDRWLSDGRIRITRTNAGRIVFGRRNLARHNPTARLVHWIAQRSEGGLVSERLEGGSAGSEAGVPRHRLWFLLSCRSVHAFAYIRESLSASELALVGMPGTLASKQWEVLPWILDAIRARSDWNEIVGAVNGCAYHRGLVVDACDVRI